MSPESEAGRVSISLPGLILFLAALGLVSCAAGSSPIPPIRPGLDVTALQKDVVARLAGAEEIAPGLKLPNRSTPENRTAARVFLAALWTRLGLDVQVQEYGPEGRNVFAVLPATVPSAEFVVVGAHYDSSRNSPGANDNATGVALVSAAAAVMAGIEPRARNLVFVLFDEEERGLRGSRAFAEKWKAENRITPAVLTVDQMGWDADGDRAVELELPFEGAEALFAEASAALASPVPFKTTDERGSDHSAFRRLGYAAVGLTEEYRNEDTTPHIHRPGDTPETVNFDYLKSSTDLMIAVLRKLVR